MRRRIDWCDWCGLLHYSQRLLRFLVRDLWSGHAPQALVVVLGLLRPFTGREDDDRLIGAAYTHVGDRRYPGKRRAQLGLARLRGVAGPGDLADARRVVVLGTRGQAALPPFCSAVLGRRRHRICGAPLHLSLVARARAASRVARAPCLLIPGGGARSGGLRAASRLPRVVWLISRAADSRRLPRWRVALTHSLTAPPRPFFKAWPQVDRNNACLERYSKLKELERRLRHRRQDVMTRGLRRRRRNNYQ